MVLDVGRPAAAARPVKVAAMIWFVLWLIIWLIVSVIRATMIFVIWSVIVAARTAVMITAGLTRRQREAIR